MFIYFLTAGAIIVAIRVTINLKQPKCKPLYDVTNKIIIVTGANSGIGYETTKYLYKKGAKVILACRDKLKAEKAIETIKKECKNEINHGQLIFFKLDLNCFDSINTFVNEIKENNLNVFSLINNAGIYNFENKINKEGFETQMMVNHLGTCLLSELLLPNLIKTGSIESPSKIIFVSSTLYKNGKIDDNFFEAFKMKEEEYKKTNMYSNSKLSCLLYARKMSQNIVNSNYPLYVNIASPGIVYSNLSRNDKYRWFKFVLGFPFLLFFLRSPKQGSQTILECTLANNLNSNGNFYRKCKQTNFLKIANDQHLIEKVYNLTRKALKIK